jgi:hypothetical protein
VFCSEAGLRVKRLGCELIDNWQPGPFTFII